MKSGLEIGQVISAKIRFNNNGDIATSSHPYLIVHIDETLGTIEIAQIDSMEGKKHKAFMKSNKPLYADNPLEKVIDKDSFVQLDNTIKLEDFNGIQNYRRQTDKLSPQKLQNVLSAYHNYHLTHEIDDNKNVYMDEREFLSLN